MCVCVCRTFFFCRCISSFSLSCFFFVYIKAGQILFFGWEESFGPSAHKFTIHRVFVCISLHTHTHIHLEFYFLANEKRVPRAEKHKYLVLLFTKYTHIFLNITKRIFFFCISENRFLWKNILGTQNVFWWGSFYVNGWGGEQVDNWCGNVIKNISDWIIREKSAR